MSDARSGKSKLIKVSEVLNDYRNQIFNSVKGGKSCEEEKKEFDVIVLKLQEWITTLELEKDDLEQYGCQAVWKSHVQMYLCLVLTEPAALGLNASHTEIKKKL